MIIEDSIHFDQKCYSDDPYQSLEYVAFKKGLCECIATLPEKEALAKEEELGWTIFGTKDSKEGMKAFKEKRKPNFIGE